MKNLKKFFAVLVVVTLMVSSIIMPASAADNFSYSDQANKLHDLGLYNGVSTDPKVFNPDLGTTLNRETGVVMLLRLVGLEKAATDMAAADVTAALAKFKDAKTISSWAKNQVAYAVKNGLVVGTTETTFAPKASLNGKAYCTLILRQLGYEVKSGDAAAFDAAPTTLSEKGGITAAEATKFAAKAALIKDDLVGISFGSLSAKDKDGKVLFVKLIDAKVITAEAAAKVGLETAKIASVKAENGKVTVVFDKAPVNEPAAADFTVTQAIYGSDATTVTATVYYTAADKTAVLNVAPVAQAAAAQKVTMSVKYKSGDAVSATEFEVPALATYDVKTVRAIANTKAEVLLNAEITATNKADFVIKDDAGTALEVKDAVLVPDKKSIVISTAAMKENTVYNLTAQGKSYKFIGIAAETDKPKLTVAAATRNTKVKLTFNERVDQASAFNVANYTIAGLSVLSAEFGKDSNGNLVQTDIVLTTSAQTSGSIYKVVVANVTDLNGNVIDADNDEMQFGGLPADTTKPKLSVAAATTNTKVILTFTEDGAMDKASAETVANYTIAGLSVLKAELTADKEVTLTTSAQTSGSIYKVVIANVKDDSGNVIDADYDEMQFGGMPPDTTKPKLASAVAKNNTSVELTFTENDAMDEVSSETATNYTIAGLTITKAELNTTSTDANVKNKVVTLTTSAQTAGNIYKVAVVNVKDVSNNVIDADYDEFQFGGVAADTAKPKVTGAVATNSTTVKVTFSEAMDETSAAQTWCYYLGTELGYPTSVVKDDVVTNGTVWKLTTKEQAAKSYTVDVTGATDTSGNAVDEDNDTYTFPGVAATDATAPKVSAAIGVDKTTMKITFNEALGNDAGTHIIVPADFTFAKVSGSEAADATKLDGYTGSNANDKLILSDDKKTVTLEFATKVMTGGVVYKVTVSNVKDTSNNTIDAAYNNSTFAGMGIDNPAPKVSSVISLNDQTLKVIFSEPIKVDATLLTAADFSIDSGYTGVFNKAILSSDKTYLTVYFKNDGDNNTTTDRFVGGKIYKLTINDTGLIKDIVGMQAISTTNDENKANFAGLSSTATSPKISSVIAVNVNTIDVTFDQRIVIDKATKELVPADITFKKYSDSSDIAATVKLVRTEGDEGTKLRIFVDGTPFTAGVVYKVIFSNGHVFSQNDQAIADADNNAVYAAVSTENAAPAIASVQKTSATTIKVVFNEKITGLKASGADFAITNLGDYTISAADMDTADDTGKTVIITLVDNSGTIASGIKTISIASNSTIKDEAGVGAVDGASKMDFAY